MRPEIERLVDFMGKKYGFTIEEKGKLIFINFPLNELTKEELEIVCAFYIIEDLNDIRPYRILNSLFANQEEKGI